MATKRKRFARSGAARPDPATLQETLTRLAAAYHRQRLVPFIGAGMSVPTFRQWSAFVQAIEKLAGTRPAATRGLLLERSHRALQKLRRDQHGSLRQAIHESILSSHGDPTVVPAQTRALASMEWPLVVTTNYDDLYLRAVRRHAKSAVDGHVTVAGRTPIDCQRVLAALHGPSEPLLWALHGYIGSSNGKGKSQAPLPDDQLVVGHEEYRQVLHKEAHFRRAFTEVLRSRSLLFLGCGLGDPDILSLLDEAIALIGTAPYPHYAVLFESEPDWEAKAQALTLRLHVTPIVLPAYGDMAEFLLPSLARRARSLRPITTSWTYAMASKARSGRPPPVVTIARGPLPLEVGKDEGIMVSAGILKEGAEEGKSALYFSPPIQDFLGRCGVNQADLGGRLAAQPGTVVPVGNTALPGRLVAGFAREPSQEGASSGDDGRDARRIVDVMGSAYRWAERRGILLLHAQLLASGKHSPFPPWVALANMLRGFAGAAAEAQEREGRQISLCIHVMKAGLLADLTSGRFDPCEFLAGGKIRFWVEVQDGERIERHLELRPSEFLVGDLATELFLTSARWAVRVQPLVSVRAGEFMPVSRLSGKALEELGLLPGATLQFTRVPPAAAPAASSPTGHHASTSLHEEQ